MKKTSREIRLTIPSRLQELKRIEHLSKEVAGKMGLSEDQHDNLSIAITEAVGNAIVHGNKKDPTKEVRIHIKVRKDRVHISVRDQGKGFNPDKLSDPLDPQNLMKESGRGIFILKTLMDEVSFSFSPEGATVEFVMRKRE